MKANIIISSTLRRWYTVVYLLVSVSCHLMGQSNFAMPKVPIPDEAKITRFKDYPMDYCTGLPDISIPLYEVKSGDIVLPITLKYHAAGFRPCENYSNVGLGWSLFAEPNLTQNIRGGLDVYVSPSSFSIDGTTLRRAWKRELDEQSDLYRYRLLNSSGILLWDLRPNTFTSFPYEYIDVSRSGTDINPKFSITEPEGILYIFEGLKEYERDYRSTLGNLSYKCTSLWSRTTKGKISFDYYTPHIQNYFISREEFRVERKGATAGDEIYSASIRNGSFASVYQFKRENCSTWWEKDNSVTIPLLGNTCEMRVCNLNTIETLNETIKFWYTIENMRVPYTSRIEYKQHYFINHIDVTRKSDGKKIRGIKFEYGNFAGYYPKLKAIHISYGRGKGTQSYEFQYYGEDFSSLSTTMERIDQYVDDFGFYNSQVGVNPDFYSIKLNTSTFGTIYATANPYVDAVFNRAAADYPKYCTNDAMLFTLKEIKLPTGGKIEYRYEGNEVVTENGESVFAGLRVRDIIHIDSGKFRQRRFEYGDSSRKSYGRLYRKKQDFYYYTSHVNGYHYETWSVYRNPLISLGYEKAPILYDQVNEYTYDGDDYLSKKIQRRYFTTFPSYQSPSKMVPSVNTGFIHPSEFLDQSKYGLLRDEIHFKKENGNYTPVKEIRYDYNMNIPQVNYSPKISDRQVYSKLAERDVRNNILDPGYDTTYSAYEWMGGKNTLQSLCHKPLSKATVLYTPSGDTLSCLSEKYSYTISHPYMTLLEKESIYPTPPLEEWEQATTPTPIGKIRSVQHILYPRNIPGHPLTRVHFISIPVQVTDSVNGKFVSRTVDEYKNSDSPVKSKVKSYFDPLLQDSMVGYFDAHDDHGNVLEAHKEGYPKTVFHWGYNKLYIVARIDNYTLAQLHSNSQLVEALNQLQEYADGFSDAGLRSQLQTLNNLIRSLVPADVRISTYTYDFLIGMTSQTTPNGQTTYYEYDNWDQLKTIRNHRYEIEKSYWMNLRK